MALRRSSFDEDVDAGRQALNLAQPPRPALRRPEPAAPRRALSDYTPEELDAAQQARAVAATSETEKAFNLGVAGVQSGLYATRGLARNVAFGDGSGDDDLRKAVAIGEEAARQGPEINRIEDIGGVGDALAYARNQIVQQVPNLALTIGTGGAAGALRSAAGAGARRYALRRAANEIAAEGGQRVVSREARQEALQQARQALPGVDPVSAGRATQRAVQAGAVASGTALQAGQTAEAALDDRQGGTSQGRSAKAAAGAIATGALEALPALALLRRFGLAPAEDAVKGVVSGRLAARVAKQAGAQAAVESTTELAQTVGELATHKWINDDVSLVDDDAMSAYINAAVGGAIGGAAFGAPAGIRSGKGNERVAGALRQGWDSLTTKLGDLGGGRVGEVVSQGTETVRDAAQRAGEAVRRATEGGATAARATYDKYLGKQLGNAQFNAVMGSLSTQPFDFTVIDNEAVISGAPLKLFVDKPRALKYKQELGLSQRQAMFASAVANEADVSRLIETGALEAATKAFTGWDTGKFSSTEKEGLKTYLGALSEDKRVGLQRLLVTFEAMDKAGVLERNKDGSLSSAYVYQPESAGPLATSSESDDTQARAAAQAERARAGIAEAGPEVQQNVGKAIRGAPARGASVGNITMTDEAGQRRIVNLGGAIAELRKDPAFVASINALPAERRTEAQVAAALGAAIEAGQQIDLRSIRPGVKLASDANWVLTPAAAARIRAGFGDQAAQRQLADQAKPLQPRERPTATGDEGLTEVEQEQGEETGVRSSPLDVRKPVLPGQGSPGSASDRAIDTGTVDTRTLREESRPERGVQRRLLDQAIGRVTNEQVTNKSRERQIGVVRKRLANNPQALRLFNERVYEHVKARADSVQARIASLRKQRTPKDVKAGQKITEEINQLKKQLKALRERETRERAQIRAAPSRFAVAKKESNVRSAVAKRIVPAEKEETRNTAREKQPGALTLRPSREKGAGERSGIFGNAQTAAGLEVTEGESALGNAQAVKRIREYFKAGREQRDKAAEFNAAVHRLLETDDGVQRLIERMQKTRSRAQLMRLSEAIGDFRVTDATFERWYKVDKAFKKRAAALHEEIATAGNKDLARGGLRQARQSEEVIAGQKVLFSRLSASNLAETLKNLLPYMRPEQQAYAQHLLDSGAVRGVKFFYDEESLVPAAFYNLDDDRVVMRPDVFSGPRHSMFETLLHEATHAATFKAESANPKLAKELNNLLNHVRDAYEAVGGEPDTWYGMADTQEFLAEAFGNPLFQDTLASLPPLNTATFKNAWEEFKDWIKRILGLNDTQATALDEVLTLGAVLMREQAAARSNTFSGIFNGTTLGNAQAASASLPTDWVSALPPDAKAAVLSAFDTREMRERLRRFLAPEDRYLLDTADVGPYLQVNLGLSLALDGKIKLDPETRGFVRQLWDMISQALRIPNANVLARQLVKDIRSGDFNGRDYDVKQRAIVRGEKDAFGKSMLSVQRFIDNKVAPVYDGLLKNMNTRMRNTGVPALRELASLVAQRTGEYRGDKQTSYRQRYEQKRGEELNRLGRLISGISEENRVKLTRALQTGKRPSDEFGPVFDQVREFLDDMHGYMAEFLDLPKVEQYFPISMDLQKLAANREAFFELHRAKNFRNPIRNKFRQWTQDKIDKVKARADEDGTLSKADQFELERLEAVYAGIGKRKIDELIGELYDMALFGGREHYIEGVDFTHPKHKPSFTNANHRVSDFIIEHGTPEQREAFAQFQTDDLGATLVSYVNRSVRRTEWEAMDMTGQIEKLLEKATKQGATPAHIQMAQDYVNMEMGTYNDSWNPVVKRMFEGFDRTFNTNLAKIDFQKFKAVQGALIAYNNVRLLPLALVSSFVDPIGPMVRSGTMKDAHKNMRDAWRALRNTEGTDELRRMADTLGLIEREELGDIMAHLYGNVYDPNSTAAKVNGLLFRYNGLNAMTRYTRLTALAAAHRFLIRHKQNPNEHSARYFKELGLVPDDITVEGGFVRLTPRVETALRRFVDEATVRPYPGQRPSWHNDPNFGLAAQYKGYLYAFYENVMLRAWNEGWVNGNPAVMAPILLYLPITALAEMGRDLAQGDDEEKELDDYARLSLERSGLLGARAGTLMDVKNNVNYGSPVLGTIAGPTGEQLGDAYDVATGEGSFGTFAEQALPGQALYREWGDTR